MLKWFAAFAMLIGLAACDGKTIALGDIAGEVQKQCGYVVTYQSIAKVVVTLVAGFDANAGSAATVAEGVANSVVASVCNAVRSSGAKVTPAGAEAVAAVPTPLTVTVNGVKIDGYLVK